MSANTAKGAFSLTTTRHPPALTCSYCLWSFVRALSS